jgi:hypothetical protein
MVRFRRDNGARADRLTLGLAGLAAATAGTVLAGEVAKLARRRAREMPEAETALDSAEHALLSTGEATSDTLVVALEGYDATPRGETVLFNILTGFVGAFVLVRVSTTGIRSGWWPTTDVVLGGRHIHHFVPGILLAFVSGGAGLITQSPKLEQSLAFPFGAGIGLTFDEAALLLDLRDVYWTREGILSVQVSLGLSAILGGTIIFLRMLRRGEERVEERGDLPPAPERMGPLA